MGTIDLIEDTSSASKSQSPSWLPEETVRDQAINSHQRLRAMAGTSVSRKIAEGLGLTFLNPDLIITDEWQEDMCGDHRWNVNRCFRNVPVCVGKGLTWHCSWGVVRGGACLVKRLSLRICYSDRCRDREI